MKITTLKQLIHLKSVKNVTKNYDGPGIHLIELQDDFEAYDSGIIIADAKTILDDFNSGFVIKIENLK